MRMKGKLWNLLFGEEAKNVEMKKEKKTEGK